MSAGLPTALYTRYAVRYGFGPGVLTLIFAAFAAGIVVVLLTLGSLADRAGYHPVLIAAVLLAILASILFATADDVAMLFIARFLHGAAIGLALGAGTAALADLHPTGDASQAALASTVANVLGQASGALLGGVFGQWLPLPLRLVWLTHIAVLAVGLALLLGLPRGGPRPRPGWLRLEALTIPAGMRTLLLINSAGAFAMGAVLGLYSSLTPSLLHALLHLPSLALAGAVSFLLLFVSAGVQVALRSLNPRTASVSGLLTLACGLIVVTTAAAVPSLPLLLTGTVVAGIGQGLTFLDLLAAVTVAAPAAQRSDIVSFFFAVTWLGVALPSLGIGFAAPAFGLLTAVKIFAAVVILLALAAATGLLGFRYAGR